MPSVGVKDMEFLTEMCTSLLTHARQLQALLEEKEETLKSVDLEKSRLEVEAEGLTQRLRSLDESEQRYKDENWSLETQIHELLAAAKHASDREQRLNNTLSLESAEKTAAQRELDELKQANGKLIEDYAATRKHQDSELSTLRRNLTLGDSERAALQRKVEELNYQNQELAKAIASRIRDEEAELPRDVGSDNEDANDTRVTPEHSPPPSPVKGTPRHSVLETETMKSSLHHAHRMIQNLKSNIHREKSEKVELKRMLQEARDELELRRGDANGVSSASKRQKAKAQHDNFKKPARPSRLGGERTSRTDVLVDETGWEDHTPVDSPGKLLLPGSVNLASELSDDLETGPSDVYQTADETEDSFDTANERDTATETEAFQTGAESLAGDSSDELTETEGDVARGRMTHQKRPSTLADSKPGDFQSFKSTASDSTDDSEAVAKTPIQAQPQRYRLKINRGAASRRSRMGSEALSNSTPSSMKDSPTSFIGSTGRGGQNLFAELGDLNGGESEEEVDGTPSKVYSHSQTSSPVKINTGAIPEIFDKVPMVDSAMMTEPWEPAPALQPTPSGFAGEPKTDNDDVRLMQSTSGLDGDERSLPWNRPVTPTGPATRDMGTQRTPRSEATTVGHDTSLVSSLPRLVRGKVAGIFGADNSGASSENSSAPAPVGSIETDRSTSEVEKPTLSLSGLQSQQIEPRRESVSLASSPDPFPSPSPLVPLKLSFIQSLEIAPVDPIPVAPYTETQRVPLVSNATPSEMNVKQNQPTLSSSRTSKARTPAELQIAEDGTSQAVKDLGIGSVEPTNLPFKDISTNVAQNELSNKENPLITNKPFFNSNTDQGSQTTLSAEQIEKFLSNKGRPDAASPVRNSSTSQMIPPALRTKSPESPTGSIARARARMADPAYSQDDPTMSKSLKRPGSAGSIRLDLDSHPPLPPDHREAIAAAAQKVPSADVPPGIMGPPLAPASAYKLNRPRTPNEPQASQTSLAKNGTTPRPRVSTTRSQVSRRSSFSSFASELDERFNIRADGFPMQPGTSGPTDSRMISAITQTMIGEYLWKYTRKAGRGELSDSRHRRYVWVHPYTRTLHWSERGPSTSGKAEGASKNLPIEGVRVVTDDNPMPPGLHRKSLEIVTPERVIKLTAATGQRHETWFNAISYLLLRNAVQPGSSYSEQDYGQNSTPDDVGDYSLSTGRNRRSGNARVSTSSYNSRITSNNNPSPYRNNSSASRRRPPPAASAHPSTNSRVQKHQPSQGSISRLSHMFKPGNVRGSFSSRVSRQSFQDADVTSDPTPAAHDSAEDLRQVIEKHEKDADRLENVRACCDGEFSPRSRLSLSGKF